MSLDRSKYYGHWVPLSCYDVRRLNRIAVQSSDPKVRKEYAKRLIHFYNNTHPITHIRLTGSVMSVNVRTINNDIHGKLSVSLEVDDGSGELVTASFLWNGDMEGVRSRYEKLLYKTVSVRGTPYTRLWNEAKVVSLDLKAVDLLDFAGEMEAIDNRMYTLEQLSLSPTFDYSRELPEKEKPEVRFLDYEVMSFKNAVSFTDVEKGEVLANEKEGDKVREKTGTEKKGQGKELEPTEGTEELKKHDNDKKKGIRDIGEEIEVQDTVQYPNLTQLFKLPSAGKTPKTIQLPQEVVIIDEDEVEANGAEETGGQDEVSESYAGADGDASGAEADVSANVDAGADTGGDSCDIDANSDPEVVVIEDEEEEEEVDTVEDDRDEPADEQTVTDTEHNESSPEPVDPDHPTDTGVEVEATTSESDDEFGIMNKFQFGKSTSPEAQSQASSSPLVVQSQTSSSPLVVQSQTSSSPLVVEFSSSLSKDGSQNSALETTTTGTTKPTQCAGKAMSESPRRVTGVMQSTMTRRPRPKFKNTNLPALKRRKYTPDMA